MIVPGSPTAMLLAGGFAFNYVISADTANFNVRTAAIAAGWDGIAPLKATVMVNAGVYVYSTSTASPAFDTGTPFPSGSTITLINNGYIYGMGGAGATGGRSIFPSPTAETPAAGSSGGPALNAQAAITVVNIGVIAGGGGGGGGGGGAYRDSGGWFNSGGGGGGGGQGYNGGALGSGGSAGGAGTVAAADGNAGTAGSKTANGTAGSGAASGGGEVGGDGGNGAALGATGSSGTAGTAGADGAAGSGSAGGSPGNSVTGNSNITWAVTGTRTGPIA